MLIHPILAASGVSILDSARQTGEQFGFNKVLFFSNVLSFLIVCALLNHFAYKPILAALEARRQRIAQSLADTEQIKTQLAEAEARHAEILDRANDEAQKMIAEARAAANALAQTRQQQAIVEAEQIVVQAREAIALERDRMLADLRREVVRLVVETTGKVAGRVLTAEDQRRLSQDAASEISA
jgi:F-type H+-transporting ATPase subunit b